MRSGVHKRVELGESMGVAMKWALLLSVTVCDDGGRSGEKEVFSSNQHL